MQKKVTLFGIAAALLVLLATAVSADVPQLITYQGRLLDTGGTPYNGAKLVRFQIYNSASASIWNSGAFAVTFDDGLFAVTLGATPQPVLPSAAFSSDTLLTLGITVDVDPEISPRTRFTTVGFSFQSQNAQNADLLDGQQASEFATLSANNSFSGSSNQFQNDLRVDGNIGIQAAPFSTIEVYLAPPDLATTAVRYGYRVDLLNSSTGIIFGTYSQAFSSTAGSGGIVFGVRGTGVSDGSQRYGVFGNSLATNSAITTGFSYGVYGQASDGAVAYGVYGMATSATTNWAGYFAGDANVTGTLSKGGGAFRIDHPLDPENKILQHSFIESPDMMNVYNGNVTSDAAGLATVVLPDYFEALNRDFRYQLTVIGQFAQAIIANEISGNQFTLQTDKPNVKVSWQVTGIRQDKWAEQNRIQVELDKLPDQKGLYLHATEYGLPVDKSVDREQIRESERMRAESAASPNEN